MKEKKRKITKLAPKDHILYFISYLILFPFLFPLPWIMFIRNMLFLNSSKVLALSNGYGLLWVIPTTILSAVFIGYIACCESKKIVFSNLIKEILRNKVKLFIMIFGIVGILTSLLFSITSSRIELTDKRITKYNILGIETQTIDTQDVDKVEFVFDSAYVSNGRYGKSTILLSYCVYVDNDFIEFDSYDIEDLFDINQIFIEKPHIITNEFYLDRWLADLNCNPDVKSKIEKIFKE